MKKIIILVITLLLTACSNQNIDIKEYSLASDIDGILEKSSFEIDDYSHNVFVSEIQIENASKVINRNIRLYLNPYTVSRAQVEIDNINNVEELVSYLFNNKEINEIIEDYELSEIIVYQDVATSFAEILQTQYPTSLQQNAHYGAELIISEKGITINKWDKLNVPINNKSENGIEYISYYYIDTTDKFLDK